jgi:Domain of unknown function (DUF4328)
MSHPRFRSVQALGIVVIVLLGIQIVIGAMSIDASLTRVELMERAIGGDLVTVAQVRSVERRMVQIAAWGIGALIATAAVWAVWQYRAQANLVRRHAADLRFTPAWAAGWWFVPVANLVRPFQAMNELSRATAAPEGRSSGSGRSPIWIPVFWIWWLSWLAGGFTQRGLVYVRGWSDRILLPADVRTYDLASIAAASAIGIAALLAIAIVASITIGQPGLAEGAPQEFLSAADLGADRDRPIRPDMA